MTAGVIWKVGPGEHVGRETQVREIRSLQGRWEWLQEGTEMQTVTLRHIMLVFPLICHPSICANEITSVFTSSVLLA